MEIELTSCREDGNWTWRAVGAREPRGALDSILIPAGVSVGDRLRVETEQDVDGILITAVLPSKILREEPERLELLGSGESIPNVTATLASSKRSRRNDDSVENIRKGRRRRDDSRKRAKRTNPSNDHSKSGPTGDGKTGRSSGSPRRRKGSGEEAAGAKKSRPTDTGSKNTAPPRPYRLRPKRKNRNTALAGFPEEQRRLADVVLRSGVPGLRSAIEKQNDLARTAGEPEIPPDILLRLAERIYPTLRTAEWLDRAEAAVSNIDKVDLRDLRSIVVASEGTARDQHTRTLADQLRLALTARVDREHSAWVDEVRKAIEEGREVRALRLSSHPPKAGAPLPEQILSRLTEIANNGLSPDVNHRRWGTLLDAVALSPVRQRVEPTGVPENPSQELLDLVRQVGTQVPQIAALFGVKPTSRLRGRSGGNRARS